MTQGHSPGWTWTRAGFRRLLMLRPLPQPREPSKAQIRAIQRRLHDPVEKRKAIAMAKAKAKFKAAPRPPQPQPADAVVRLPGADCRQQMVRAGEICQREKPSPAASGPAITAPGTPIDLPVYTTSFSLVTKRVKRPSLSHIKGRMPPKAPELPKEGPSKVSATHVAEQTNAPATASRGTTGRYARLQQPTSPQAEGPRPSGP